jgi:hypothetical protein
VPGVWKWLRRWVYEGRVESPPPPAPRARRGRRAQRTSPAGVAGVYRPTCRSDHLCRPTPPGSLARRSPSAHPRNRSRGEEHRDGDWSEVQALGDALDATRSSPPAQAPPVDRALGSKLVRSLALSSAKCSTQPQDDPRLTGDYGVRMALSKDEIEIGDSGRI